MNSNYEELLAIIEQTILHTQSNDNSLLNLAKVITDTVHLMEMRIDLLEQNLNMVTEKMRDMAKFLSDIHLQTLDNKEIH
jgi:hypothetical protein